MSDSQGRMSVDDAYRLLADELLDFVGREKFDCAKSTTKVWSKASQSSYARFHGNSTIENDRFPSMETMGPASRAVEFLRKHLLQTTGQRIYGLTFTLYPDGKFTIDYDYERPADYDDSEETISLEEALGSLGQAGIAANLTDADNTPERRFLAAAMTRLQAHTAEHTRRWGLGSETRWNLDMNAGTLQLSFADGRDRSFSVQIVGTYNTENGTFLWAWDHPSVPEPLRRAARRMREYGEREGFERLTTRTLACTENDAWELTAAAAQLDGVTGAYRGDAGGTVVYMSFDADTVSAASST